jgi:hypothetical protein
MKTQELKEMIRSVIKEELQKTLPTLIPNILSEILTGQNKTVVSEKLETPKVSQKPSENIQSLQPAKKTFKKYTNNDVLNAVLNETVGGIPREGSYAGLMGALRSESLGGANINESVEIPQQITPVNEEQAKVLNVINRDFRKLMKAVDKKRTSGLGGSGLVSMS